MNTKQAVVREFNMILGDLSRSGFTGTERERVIRELNQTLNPVRLDEAELANFIANARGRKLL